MPDPTLTPAQLTELSDICIVANTPAYLFKHLSSNGTVQALAHQHTVTELLTYARNSLLLDPLTLDHASAAYACLVAATLRPFDELKVVPEDAWPKMRWTKELREVARGTPSTTSSVLVVSGKPNITVVNAPQGPSGDQAGTRIVIGG